MTREKIEDIRFIVIPFVANILKGINYEGQGDSDAKEFIDDFNVIFDLAIKALEQEPKTGHWIEHEWKEMREKGYYRCSVCNYAYQRYTKGIRKSDVPYIDGQEYILWNCDNYCPNCGCRMVEPQKSEDKE